LMARQIVDLLVPACSDEPEGSRLREDIAPPPARMRGQRERNAVKEVPTCRVPPFYAQRTSTRVPLAVPVGTRGITVTLAYFHN
jgi:hypothetical protein